MFGSKIIRYVESNKGRWIAVNNEGFELYSRIASFFMSHGYMVVASDYVENYDYIVFKLESTDKKFLISTDCIIQEDDIESNLEYLLCESPVSIDIGRLV